MLLYPGIIIYFIRSLNYPEASILPAIIGIFLTLSEDTPYSNRQSSWYKSSLTFI